MRLACPRGTVFRRRRHRVGSTSARIDAAQICRSCMPHSIGIGTGNAGARHPLCASEGEEDDRAARSGLIRELLARERRASGEVTPMREQIYPIHRERAKNRAPRVLAGAWRTTDAQPRCGCDKHNNRIQVEDRYSAETQKNNWVPLHRCCEISVKERDRTARHAARQTR